MAIFNVIIDSYTSQTLIGSHFQFSKECFYDKIQSLQRMSLEKKVEPKYRILS
jgi:hypothetical protein